MSDYDVAILGGGFAGSLTGLLLARIGRRVLILDRQRHPRFAIGESSTPTANLLLRAMAARYDVPELEMLSRYGTWKAHFPELDCGRKRGFSYFQHTPGKPFAGHPQHANELLVAASSQDATSDTHWLRADVDTFLLQQAQSAGADAVTGAANVAMQRPARGAGWDLRWRDFGGNNLETADRPDPSDASPTSSARCRFLIDATGGGRGLQAAVGLCDRSDLLQTRSRAIYSHFVDVPKWEDLYHDRGGRANDHPFACDHSAQHHLLDEGWLWALRFDSGITSLGLALDERRPLPPAAAQPGDDAPTEWRIIDRDGRYPVLTDWLQSMRLAETPGGWRTSGGRLQRRADRAVGPDWALLPHAAGFIDPLHSTGIAHSLVGIERLLRLFEQSRAEPPLLPALRDYERQVFEELALIDLLVDGCYGCLGNFRLFVLYSMLYFAAATCFERERIESGGTPAFLCANDRGLTALVASAHGAVRSGEARRDPDSFERWLTRSIAPFNQVGLCDPSAQNMYRYTACE